jgi:hypothetical protein
LEDADGFAKLVVIPEGEQRNEGEDNDEGE